MKHPRKTATFILLMVLASNAAAVTSKCTGAHGEVIYTNTACPPGYEAKAVEENVSVVDASAERALIAGELEKAKTAASDNSGNEITAGGPTAADLARLKDVASLGQTAITARERLWLATAIFIGIALILRILFRRKKRPADIRKESIMPHQ